MMNRCFRLLALIAAHRLIFVMPFVLLLGGGASVVRADEIDDYLRAQMVRNRIPGLSVAVVREGKIIKINAYGVANLEWEQPATTDTAFQIASSTKPFTGAALMLLVQDGKIALDDKISKYLPDAPAAWQSVTVRHLATHSSGITNNVGAKPDASVEEYVKTAYAKPLDYEPGAKSAYGFTDFVVLTHIIEKVSGRSFPDFLKSRLFEPLGMTSTGFDFSADGGPVRSADVVRKRATVYRWENNRQRSYTFLYPVRGYSAGGLFSTSADIAKFAAALDAGKLLSPANLEQMWSREKLADGTANGFGVGWIVDEYNGRRTVGHSGGPALGDILRFPDEKLTIVVLTNGHKLYPYLARGVADFYFPPAPLKEAKAIADADADLTRAVKKVLADGFADRLDDALFTAEAQKGFVPNYRFFGLPFFVSLDPLGSLVLLEHRENETGVTRVYRSVHGRRAVRWSFRFDRDKKIASFDSKPE